MCIAQTLSISRDLKNARWVITALTRLARNVDKRHALKTAARDSTWWSDKEAKASSRWADNGSLICPTSTRIR